MKFTLSKNQLRRFPVYLTFFKRCEDMGLKYINSSMVAEALNLNEEQVRKDIQLFSTVSGVPNKGREIKKLITDIERVLGCESTNNAVLVGVGSLGKALLNYHGFDEYGLKIVAGFDKDEKMIGKKINDVSIYDIHRMYGTIKDMNAYIGIICVPTSDAQEVCNLLIESGIEAIWNFSPTRLNVPSNIIISDVNMAVSLAELSHKLYMQKLKENKNGK